MIRENVKVKYSNGAIENYANVDKLRYDHVNSSIRFSYIEGDKAVEAEIALTELANRTANKLCEKSAVFINGYFDACRSITDLNETLKKGIRRMPEEFKS